MLQIKVPAAEFYDEVEKCFVNVKETKLQLEHSLLSLSKWESKWHKPFLSDKEKTADETIDYIRCMTITNNVDPMVYVTIAHSSQIMTEIKNYMDDKMTATWFNDEATRGEANKKNRKVITAEIIYYWMIAANIPFECEKWHLNRLFTLIRVCDEKSKPPKKMSKKDQARWQRNLNAQRKARHS